jgi:hypothetical protein
VDALTTPITELGPGERLASLDDFVLSHVTRIPTAMTANAVLAHGVQRGPPSRLGLVYLIERSGVGVPDAEARAAFVHLSRSSEPYYAASTLVVDGGGLAAGITHAFVQSVRALSGGRLPLAIFGDLTHALPWLRQALPQRSRLPSDDEIERLIARVRALP